MIIRRILAVLLADAIFVVSSLALFKFGWQTLFGGNKRDFRWRGKADCFYA